MAMNLSHFSEGAAKLNDCVAKFFQKQIEQAEQCDITIQIIARLMTDMLGRKRLFKATSEA
eukprot:1317797-Amorphochlora_amoeboformis.AAC.1